MMLEPWQIKCIEGQRRWRERVARGEVIVKKKSRKQEDLSQAVAQNPYVGWARHVTSLEKQVSRLREELDKKRSTATEDLATAIMLFLRSEPISAKAGVYFLINGDVIAYVGQSTNCLARTAGRAALVDKAVMVAVEDKSERMRLEALCIRIFRPRANVHFNGAA